jgi:hypothetical protein
MYFIKKKKKIILFIICLNKIFNNDKLKLKEICKAHTSKNV